jgi:hypothetical protein
MRRGARFVLSVSYVQCRTMSDCVMRHKNHWSCKCNFLKTPVATLHDPMSVPKFRPRRPSVQRPSAKILIRRLPDVGRSKGRQLRHRWRKLGPLVKPTFRSQRRSECQLGQSCEVKNDDTLFQFVYFCSQLVSKHEQKFSTIFLFTLADRCAAYQQKFAYISFGVVQLTVCSCSKLLFWQFLLFYSVLGRLCNI